MRTIIAGSRSCSKLSHVYEAIAECGWTPTVVISGTARGADQLGEMWADENNIPVVRFPADWDTHGKAAGYIRNTEMAKHADALIAIWDGESRGTRHMIQVAKSKGLKIYIHKIP